MDQERFCARCLESCQRVGDCSKGPSTGSGRTGRVPFMVSLSNHQRLPLARPLDLARPPSLYHRISPSYNVANTLAIRRAPSTTRSGGERIRAMRKCPSPQSPNPTPGVTTTPSRSTSKVARSADARFPSHRGNTKVAPSGSGQLTPAIRFKCPATS